MTFLGVQQTRPLSTHKQLFYTTGRFSVLLAACSVCKEAAQRKGGPARDEVGCNRLIQAVRRLMSRQDMGLHIEPLLPGWVRSLFSTRLNSDALAAYACEFDTVWVEEALDNGRWPAPEGDNDPDRLFADHQGRLDTPWPMHERTGLAYH
ncbi:phage protein Gp37 [Sodalis glossinidius]|uniref:phage protein Gp37 n=1 Tax=Sodalis glossinidius TaxID=63612 RepID=UPI0002E57B15|nr:phage protein Gp37 [Sodalis glossinidius]